MHLPLMDKQETYIPAPIQIRINFVGNFCDHKLQANIQVAQSNLSLLHEWKNSVKF